jgi:hypothetical protein
VCDFVVEEVEERDAVCLINWLIVPTVLIAQEVEEESESIDLSKRDDQERSKGERERERAYMAQSIKVTNRPSPRRKPPVNIMHHACR